MASDIRISVINFLVVTLMAVVGILIFKLVLSKYPIKGLSEVAGSV